VAEFAAFAGRRILVIERQVLGGLVVTTGGGPTKTLREAALHLTGFRYRAIYGITEQPDIVTAVERSRARTEEVSSAMQNFTHSFFVDRLGVDVVYGSARLGLNHTVTVTPREVSETERVFTAEKILIATGRAHFIQQTSRLMIPTFSIQKSCQSLSVFLRAPWSLEVAR
jgi:NAD(P) transhydrogenase